jgi:hypothetical protein
MTQHWSWHMHEHKRSINLAGPCRVGVAGGCVIAPTASDDDETCRIDLDPRGILGPERGRRLDPLSQLALVAVERARHQAGLGQEERRGMPVREGVAVGSALGAVATSVRYARRLVGAGPAATNPIDFPDSIDGAPAAQVALDLRLGGPSFTFVDGRSSATTALVHAARQIAWGRATRMYVVAGDKFDSLFAESIARDRAFTSPENGVGCRPAECVVALVLDAFAPCAVEPEAIELVGFFGPASSEDAPSSRDHASAAEYPTQGGSFKPTFGAAPLTWFLDSRGTVGVAREPASDGWRLEDPSGALELAGAWLGVKGSVNGILGAIGSFPSAPIARRVRCGTLGYPQLGFISSRGQ